MVPGPERMLANLPTTAKRSVAEATFAYEMSKIAMMSFFVVSNEIPIFSHI